MSADDDAFIREYEGFVRSIVTQTRGQLGLEADPKDLVAYGFQGLLEARARYEPDRGVQFKSFAYYRIRGSLLDGVRVMGWLPRRAYARLRAMEAADALGEATTSARPIAGTPDVEAGLRTIDGVLARVATAYFTGAALDETPEAHLSPEARLIARERRTRALAAIESLPEEERRLVRGHYLEGRRFDEIAQELGLSKSWASRLHSRALDRLRETLRST